MLIGLNPLLSPDLLRALRAMGHGDDIAIVDGNFPGDGFARRCIRADGHSATDMLRAVLSVMPVDDFVDDAATVMKTVGSDDVPEIVHSFQDIINELADNPTDLTRLERFKFYERAKGAYAIVQTGEARLYGNIIITKGVVRPPADTT